MKQESSVTLWAARDRDSNNLMLSSVCPRFGKYDFFTDDEAWYVPGTDGSDETALFEESGLFPEITFENSPQKVELKLIEQ